jgi:hypothetical protein
MSPVRPYIDTSTQAPGTIQPPSLPDPGPLDPRRTTAIDNLLGNVSDKVRKRMQVIMQPFPTGALEALYKHGLRFNITVKPSMAQRAMSQGGLQMLGGYNPLSRKIQFMEATLLGDLGPHTVIHEMCHALDHMRGERHGIMSKIPLLRGIKVFTGTAMESGTDKEIRALYHEYQARGNVEDVDVMRREILINNDMKKPLPEKTSFVSDFDHWGLRPVHYERKDGVESFTIEPTVKARNKRLAHAAIGGALVAGGMALPALLGPAAVAVGGLMLGVAAVGQTRSFLHKYLAPKTEVDVEMVKGAKAHVVQQDERSVVSVPDGARSFTGETWSDYAHRGNMGQEKRGAGEYVAEAYSTYLEGGDKAQLFHDNDPKMYAFVEQRLREEFKGTP